ncbi:MAG: sugar phosphate nucleotidyltransferase [Steroidobacteraceae bacterium]
MKVVLFCGGLGTRLREHSDTVPKPLVPIGYRPIVWHLMRYYAHHGHKDFILCLGYRGDLIREYFLKYEEAMTNDFTIRGAERRVDLHSSDAREWNITFVDTGMHSNIGQRLLRVRKYLQGEAEFLANYADGLSDLPLGALIEDFRRKQVVASFASVRSWHSFHAVQAGPDGYVTSMGPMRSDEFMINGGFFALRQDIFDYINEGEELVEEPFARLRERRLLATYKYDGFWQAMDTFKDKIAFDRMDAKGDSPWKVWK